MDALLIYLIYSNFNHASIALILLSKNGCIGNSYKNINHYHPTAKPGPSPPGTFHILTEGKICLFPYQIFKYIFLSVTFPILLSDFYLIALH